jgi:hypothetical protein
MATYASSTECPIADPPGSAVILDQLVARGEVSRGPTLTALSPQNTTDGCHPDAVAELSDGNALATFWP